MTSPNYLLWAIFGYILWGIFPVYFKLLQQVSPWEIVAHRIIWSFVLLFLFLLFTHSLNKLKKILSDTRSILLLGLAALLITINWTVYVYSVNTGHILEASLAYFISPLFTVMLGIIFLNEKKSSYKTIALVLCVSAILLKVIYEQSLSSHSLIIATTFSIYSMVKKKIPHHSVLAFFIEIGYLFLPALGYLYYRHSTEDLIFLGSGEQFHLLLIGLGPVTTIPLLIFARSVKNVDLSIMGFLQYITPFMIFVLATTVYGEKMKNSDGVVFTLIWIAVGIISFERVMRKRKPTPGRSYK